MVKVFFPGLAIWCLRINLANLDALRAHVAEILSAMWPEVELWDGAVLVCQSNKFMNWWINHNETNWSEGKSQQLLGDERFENLQALVCHATSAGLCLGVCMQCTCMNLNIDSIGQVIDAELCGSQRKALIQQFSKFWSFDGGFWFWMCAGAGDLRTSPTQHDAKEVESAEHWAWWSSTQGALLCQVLVTLRLLRHVATLQVLSLNWNESLVPLLHTWLACCSGYNVHSFLPCPGIFLRMFLA